MENNPFNNTEDQEDDGDQPESSKKATRIPRRLPLGDFKAERSNIPEKPKLSVSERLLEMMGAKKETPKKNDAEKLDNNLTDLEPANPTVKNEVSPDEIAGVDKGEEQVESGATDDPVDVLSPNEISTSQGREPSEGEIDLSSDPNQTENSSPETLDFVEITLSSQPESVQDDKEADDELLVSGLGDENVQETTETEAGEADSTQAPEAAPTTPPEVLADDEPDDQTVVNVRPATTGTTHHYASGGSQPVYNQIYTPSVPSQAELDAAEEDGRRSGVRKGLGAGLLFGWMFGRHGKKKAAREHKKDMQAANQKIEKLAEGQQRAETSISNLKINEQNLQARLNNKAQQISQLEKSMDDNRREKTAAKAVLNNLVETTARLSSTEEQYKSKEKVSGYEMASDAAKVAIAEKFAAAKHEQAEKIQKLEQQLDQEVESNNHRVETSAWHRIELDAKTGRVAEDPKLAYGQEFFKERQNEVKRSDDFGSSGGGSSSVIAGVAGLAASGLAKASLELSETKKAEQLALAQKAVEKELSAGQELLRYASNPLIWIAAILVVLALFAFGLLR